LGLLVDDSEVDAFSEVFRVFPLRSVLVLLASARALRFGGIVACFKSRRDVDCVENTTRSGLYIGKRGIDCLPTSQVLTFDARRVLLSRVTCLYRVSFLKLHLVACKDVEKYKTNQRG